MEDVFSKIKILGAIILLLLVIVFISVAYKKVDQSLAPAKQISDVKMNWYQISADQKWSYYFSDDPETALYKMDLEKKEIEKMSNFAELPDKTIWSPNLNKVMIITESDNTAQVYDIQNNATIASYDNVIDGLWYSDNKILLHFKEKSTSYINSVDYEKSSSTKIRDFGDLYLDVLVGITNNKLYFLATPGEGIRNLYQLNINNGQIIKKISDIGPRALISSDDTYVIIEQYNYKSELSLFWSKLDKIDLKELPVKTNLAQTTWMNQDQKLLIVDSSGEFYEFDLSSQKENKLSLKSDQFSVDDDSLIVREKSIYYTSDNRLIKSEF